MTKMCLKNTFWLFFIWLIEKKFVYLHYRRKVFINKQLKAKQYYERN